MREKGKYGQSNSRQGCPGRKKSEPTKQELQRQLERTRESLAETVGGIKETVEKDYELVRRTVTNVLAYREEFKKELLLWSLGSAFSGIRLGYTVGYASNSLKREKECFFGPEQIRLV